MKGQYELFAKNEKNEGLGEPCEHCDVEWCSLKCFLRLGYIETYGERYRFARDENGKKLRRSLEQRECKVTRFDD